MGVINIGALVEKLKKKLAGAGFITKTDYASSSAGGVIKTDSTYATDITSGGKLKSTTISAASYADANSAAFISKGTLDALITAGTIGGGGMTWTKLFEGAVASSGTGTFDTGVNPFDHKVVLIQGFSGSDDFWSAYLLPELLGEGVTSVTVSFVRADGAKKLTLSSTGVTMPNNVGAANLVIYALD